MQGKALPVRRASNLSLCVARRIAITRLLYLLILLSEGIILDQYEALTRALTTLVASIVDHPGRSKS